MTSVQLLAIGRSAMANAHGLILMGGALGVLSILAGLLSRRIGAPVLLVFLGFGILASDDGIGGIAFNDFAVAYLIGSVALAVILFQGGLTTPPALFRLAFWPALLLATVGVALTAGIVGGAIALLTATPIAAALLAGAAAAPTDAAAVTVLLRRVGVVLPGRLSALLEVESGLNDPMSIFLTIMLVHVIVDPAWISVDHAVWLFVQEMAGGAVLGLAGGWVLAWALRRLPIEPALATVLALTGALALFGLAQSVGTSGFLAIYLAGLVTGAATPQRYEDLQRFFDGIAWLSQIVLFLMLGLLVEPRTFPSYFAPAMIAAAVLIFIARPVAVFACLLPCRFGFRETAFASWVGLRGAVPIYLSFLPALADPSRDTPFFAAIFMLVVASLIVQGWTVAPAARLLGFRDAPR
jgi:NhaP-type Na+/H+ and K+/H+ antiporter